MELKFNMILGSVILLALAVFLTVKYVYNPFKSTLKKASAGDPEAQYRLGYLYYQGKYVAQDYRQAFHWFQTAAQNGYFKAHTALAGLYNAGHGCQKSDADSFKHYTLAAEQGDFEARVNLAVCHLKGIGTPVNERLGFETMKDAADDKSPIAQFLTGDMYERGVGVKKDETLALKYYILAGNQGVPHAKERIKKLKSKK